MNKFKEKVRFVQCMKDTYPPGTRLVMLSMDDPYAPIPSGMREQLSMLTMPHKFICAGITAELLPSFPKRMISAN